VSQHQLDRAKLEAKLNECVAESLAQGTVKVSLHGLQYFFAGRTREPEPHGKTSIDAYGDKALNGFGDLVVFPQVTHVSKGIKAQSTKDPPPVLGVDRLPTCRARRVACFRLIYVARSTTAKQHVPQDDKPRDKRTSIRRFPKLPWARDVYLHCSG